MFKRGDCWYSDFVYKGKRYKKSWGNVSKSAARVLEEEYRTDIRHGRLKREGDNPRFADALEEFMKKKTVECAPGTVRRYWDSAKHYKTFFGSTRVDRIENNEVLMRKFFEKRKSQIKEKQAKEGRTEQEMVFTSINQDLHFLRMLFRWLIEAGKATKNPTRFVAPFEKAQREREFSQRRRKTRYLRQSKI